MRYRCGSFRRWHVALLLIVPCPSLGSKRVRRGRLRVVVHLNTAQTRGCHQRCRRTRCIRQSADVVPSYRCSSQHAHGCRGARPLRGCARGVVPCRCRLAARWRSRSLWRASCSWQACLRPGLLRAHAIPPPRRASKRRVRGRGREEQHWHAERHTSAPRVPPAGRGRRHVPVPARRAHPDARARNAPCAAAVGETCCWGARRRPRPSASRWRCFFRRGRLALVHGPTRATTEPTPGGRGSAGPGALAPAPQSQSAHRPPRVSWRVEPRCFRGRLGTFCDRNLRLLRFRDTVTSYTCIWKRVPRGFSPTNKPRTLNSQVVAGSRRWKAWRDAPAPQRRVPWRPRHRRRRCVQAPARPRPRAALCFRRVHPLAWVHALTRGSRHGRAPPDPLPACPACAVSPDRRTRDPSVADRLPGSRRAATTAVAAGARRVCCVCGEHRNRGARKAGLCRRAREWGQEAGRASDGG